MIELLNIDCIEYMKTCKDNEFDLAICDPPYGIGKDGTIGFATEKTKGFTFTQKEYKQKDWDKTTPPQEYFDELKRVSKNQIIWGANYMVNEIGTIKNFICWYKMGKSKDDKFNECELAYVSTGRTRMIDIWWNGFGTINSGETRIHPCQKPVRLYNWILENYAQKGMKILDTHLGSGNIAVACHYFGVDLVGCEIDTEYYNGALKNYKDNTAQTLLTF